MRGEYMITPQTLYFCVVLSAAKMIKQFEIEVLQPMFNLFGRESITTWHIASQSKIHSDVIKNAH
jgi:hypothetical protein